MGLWEQWGGSVSLVWAGKGASPELSFNAFSSYQHTLAFWGPGKRSEAYLRNLSLKMSPLGEIQQTQKKLCDNFQPDENTHTWLCTQAFLPACRNCLARLASQKCGFPELPDTARGVFMAVQGICRLRFLPSQSNPEDSLRSKHFGGYGATCLHLAFGS